MAALSKYKTYPEYKDSGVEWLGEIPSHWIVSTLKYKAKFITGLTPSTQIESYYSDEPTVYQWIRPEDIVDGSINTQSSKFLSKLGWEIPRKIPTESILVCCIGTIGKLSYLNTTATTNQQITSVIPHNNSKYYFYLLLAAKKELEDMATGNVVKILNSERLGKLKITLSSLQEQTKIAQFLDHETAKIDQLIEKQQSLIELLKEKRQAVISRAVTNGLDPNVKMKDSGVEWLGAVPEHWDILPTKRFFKLVCEPAPNNNDYELLSVYTEIGVRPRKDLEQKGNKASTTDGYWIVKEHDLVVNKLLAWMGAIGYSAYNGVTSPAYDILRPSQNTNSEFYHYLFRTKQANAEFKRWSRGIMEMRLRLYFDELGNIFMPVPTLKEQNSIVAHIKAYEHKTDLLIQKSEKQIELMKERRTALISAAVTGKIDVRDWQPEQ